MSLQATPGESAGTLQIGFATDAQRATIYRMRHAIYARELGQHPENFAGELRDEIDQRNVYIVAAERDRVVGFVSVTQPGASYSIDKYLARETLPFPCDGGLHEIRLLSVLPEQRGRRIAALLMYAAFRWVETHDGTRVVALGRSEVLGLYLQVGLQPSGQVVQSGAVMYHLLHAPVDALRSSMAGRERLLRGLEKGMWWRLPFAFAEAPSCYHGGAFFEAIGEEFDTLERRERVINADVLDAWFPPSPRVMAALREHLPWLVRTSPPTDCAGLTRTIGRARGLEPTCVLPGGGSSDLIFLALTRWLTRESRVLILDPMYGEYGHVLQHVVRCRTDRLPLLRADGYRLDPRRLLEAVEEVRYDLVILVNPNSPTGQHVQRSALQEALEKLPHATRVWIDETYTDYVGDDQSLEQFAARSAKVVVCKSMSKVYALSGMRVGYLCASPATVAELRGYAPPWGVGLPAQVAAVEALRDLPYYDARWRETHALRAALAASLHRRLGFDVLPSVANFLLCHLPERGPDAATLVARARERGLFLRDAGPMGTRLGPRALRIAVKDDHTNGRMLRILSGAMER